MAIVINSNPTATTASNNLSKANEALRKSLARLSSGYRIVSPEDDAGGLAVAYKLSAQLKRNHAIRNNVQNGISLLQVQDAALTSAGTVVSRMAELRAMAQDITKNTGDIENYSKEFLELQMHLAQLYREKFNGVSLFAISGSEQKLHSGQPILHKGTSYNDSGESITKFSRRIFTHDSGRAEDGNVSIGVINFEDVFKLGALDSSHVENFTGQFANLANAAGLNRTNYSTNNALSSASLETLDPLIEANSTYSTVETVTEAAPTLTPGETGAASAIGWAQALNDNDDSTFPYGDPDTPVAGAVTGMAHKDIVGAGSYDIFLTESGIIGNNYSLEIVDNLGGTDEVVELASEEALSYSADGNYDFRLNLASTADNYSLSELKSLLESSGKFYVSLGSVTDPDAFKISDSHQWSNNGNSATASYAGSQGSDSTELPDSITKDDAAGSSTLSGGIIPVGNQSGYMNFAFHGGVDMPIDETEDTTPTDDTTPPDNTPADDTSTSGEAGTTEESAVTGDSENTTPEANAEVFTDDGFLSSILFVSMEQFTEVINRIADARAENGAEQSRLMKVDDLLSSKISNLEAAHGRIMDVDVALESSRLAKHNVLVQSSAAMVAQANNLTAIALTLLTG
jgi:flagellin-like hook-associated protein FlgL